MRLDQFLRTLILIESAFAASSWTWLSGSSSSNQQGDYNSIGSSGIPGSRYGSALWLWMNASSAEESKILYMFSGYGEDFSGTVGFLGDTWKYEINKDLWTWIAGSSTSASSPVEDVVSYNGFHGGNIPGGRIHPCSFVYNDQLYVFGGLASHQYLNEAHGNMWKLDITLNQWSWVFGRVSERKVNPQYSLSSELSPGSRHGMSCWKPIDNKLYIFGGYKLPEPESITNELWSFDLVNRQWDFVSGTSTTKVGRSVNNPGALYRPSVWVSQDSQSLFLYGGKYSDAVISGETWKFFISNESWVSVGVVNLPGSVYDAWGAVNSEETSLVFGGDYSNSNSLDKVWQYNSQSGNWDLPFGNSSVLFNKFTASVASVSYPRGISNWSFTGFDQTFFFFGGQTTSSSYSNMLFKFESNTSVTCVPGKYYIDYLGICRSCSVGKYASDINDDCSECPIGKYSSKGGASICQDCEIGTYADTIGLSACKTCEPGTISSESGSTVCSSCDPSPGFGQYSVGQDKCEFCGRGFFLNSAKNGCEACPESATSQIRSTSILDCACNQGYYGDVSVIETCSPCPVGGVCPENSSIPFVLRGFYRDPADPGTILGCVPESACPETGFNITTECSPGYKDTACASCIEYQFYRRSGECIKCPAKVFQALIIVVVIIIFGLVSYRVMVSHHKFPLEVRIALSCIQIISLFPSFSAEWPKSLLSVFQIVSFSNLDINLFSPECSVPMDFLNKTVLKLFIPFIVVVWMMIVYEIKTFFTVRRFEMFSKQQVAAFSIFFFSVFFTAITSTALSVFNCKKTRDERILSNYDPSVVCFDKRWYQYLPIISIFIMIYAVVFPSVIAFNFWRYRKNLDHDVFKSLFSNLTANYKKEYFYWEAIVMMKKLAYVLSSEFLAYGRAQSTKAFLAIFFLFVFFTLESRTQPYSNPMHNHFNLSWNFITIFILLSLLIFQSEEVRSIDKEVLGGLIIAIIAIMIVYTVYRILSSRLTGNQQKDSEHKSDVVKDAPPPGTCVIEEDEEEGGVRKH